jgi:hypothetical protein
MPKYLPRHLMLPQLLLLSANFPIVSGSYYEDMGDSSSPEQISWYSDEQMAEILEPIVSKCFADDKAIAKIANQAMAGGDALEMIPGLFFDILEDYCDGSQASQFEAALDDFHKCSGIDYKAYQETFADSIFGMVVNCARYIYDSSDSYFSYNFGEVSFPIPRVPDQCVNAFVGNNPMGDMIRQTLEHPGLDAKCYAKFSEDVPKCTLKQWPIPLPGRIIKVSSCVTAELVPEQEAVCDSQLEILQTCLPDDPELFDGQQTDEKTCGKWITQCAGNMSTLVTFPAPFAGLPLSDVCRDRAIQYPDALKKFNGFQESCVSDDDKKFWLTGSGAASLSSYNQYSNGGGSSGGSKAGTFFTGLFSGMILIGAAFFAKRKMNGKASYNDLENDSLQLRRDDFELS